ncbi:hypothetical protein JHW43_006042 [Diplocarpon mali]|nr:hypothetical protein JHW43_006042 [Diplocarpon mali]
MLRPLRSRQTHRWHRGPGVSLHGHIALSCGVGGTGDEVHLRTSQRDFGADLPILGVETPTPSACNGFRFILSTSAATSDHHRAGVVARAALAGGLRRSGHVTPHDERDGPGRERPAPFSALPPHGEIVLGRLGQRRAGKRPLGRAHAFSLRPAFGVDTSIPISLEGVGAARRRLVLGACTSSTPMAVGLVAGALCHPCGRILSSSPQDPTSNPQSIIMTWTQLRTPPSSVSISRTASQQEASPLVNGNLSSFLFAA